MAIIQTIRDKYAKLMFVVIVIALLGFIMMYATNDVGSLFRDGSEVGAVNGEKIDYKDFEAAVQERENMVKQQYQMASIDEATQAQIRNQVWQETVNNTLMDDVNKKLGLQVTESELNDMIAGPNPDPFFVQQLGGGQQKYDGQQMLNIIKQIERSNKNDENTIRQKQLVANLKKQGIQERLKSKFDAMITSALYTPQAMLDAANTERTTFASTQYVMLPYTLVNDNEVKVSDAEIKQYMETHKAMFYQKKASRSIDYVAFNIVPSKDDSAKVFTALDTIKTAFATATDAENFASRNSETQIPVMDQTKQTLQGLPNAEALLAAPVGTVVGPFISQGSSIMLAKVISKNTYPDSVKCRHILITFKQGQQQVMTDSQAKKEIDSIVTAIHSGVPFDSLVAKYSTDPGSKDKGGVYDFSLAQKASLTKPFADFIFGGKTGENKVVKVESDGYSGYHYIEILHQGAPESASKIAFISKQLVPSDATYQAISAAASTFNQKVAANPKSFDKEVQAAGLTKETAAGLDPNSSLVGQVGSSRELVKWAFDAKLGDVSPTFTIGEKMVVAKLNGIQDKGLLNITDQNRADLVRFVGIAKKAKILTDRNKGKTLEAIAQGEAQQITTDDSVTFAGARSAIGQEPKALGYAFYKSFNVNTLSPAIPGNNGVVFMTVSARNAAPQGQRSPKMEQQMSVMMNKSNAAKMVLDAMQQAADVVDRRGKIYQ